MTTGEADHRSYRYAVLADGVAHHAQIKDVHLPTLFADDHAKRAAFLPLKPTQRETGGNERLGLHFEYGVVGGRSGRLIGQLRKSGLRRPNEAAIL